MCMNPTYAPIPAYAYPIWSPILLPVGSYDILLGHCRLACVCSVLNLVCHRYWWRHNDVIVIGHPRHTMMHIGQCPNPNFVYRFPIYCTTYAIYTITTPAKQQPATHQPFPPSARIILHITWHCNLILYIRRTCKKNHFRFSFCVLLQNTPSPPPTLRILRRRYEPENITKLLVLFKLVIKRPIRYIPIGRLFISQFRTPLPSH